MVISINISFCVSIENIPMFISIYTSCISLENMPYGYQRIYFLRKFIKHVSFQEKNELVTVFQDSLLVKRRNDNHSPGPVIRELVPSSHQRSELSNTILCIFSG